MTTVLHAVGEVRDDAAGSIRHNLIICRDDRIVFHDSFASAQQRLRTCVSLLTASDLMDDRLPTERSSQVLALFHGAVEQWSTEPDQVINRISKLCRSWGVQVYVGSAPVRMSAPRALFSVITDYGSGHVVAEHFPSRSARHESLVAHAMDAFRGPRIPEAVLHDDQRLAALVATCIMPATVTLTESELDESDGFYRAADRFLPVL